jgi:nitroreductase
MVQHKPAETQLPIHELLRKRWSPRSFSPTGLTEKEVHTLIEAASWAFSASNIQPWHFLYAFRGSEGFSRILSCLLPGNAVWAKNAAVLMVSLAKVAQPNGKQNEWAFHDVGAANLQLALQAAAMDIYVHPMAGFDRQKTLETLSFDNRIFEPLVFVAIGYADDAGKLEEPFRSRELSKRSRKPVSEISTKL